MLSKGYFYQPYIKFIPSYSKNDVFIKMELCKFSTGTQEQTYIANLMMYASCVGRNKDLCHNNVDVPLACSSQTSGGSGNINANVHIVTWTVICFSLVALFL